MIFETERLLIRQLKIDDLLPFHKMQSNPLVMQYATGEPKNLEENKIELENLIKKYTKKGNDFWIYAIERNSDNEFIGTVALVKDTDDDEIGYRFLQKYWGNGYGSEVCKGLILYARTIGIKKLIGYAVDVNLGSSKILEKSGFKPVKKFISKDINLPETKYELYL